MKRLTAVLMSLAVAGTLLLGGDAAHARLAPPRVITWKHARTGIKGDSTIIVLKLDATGSGYNADTSEVFDITDAEFNSLNGRTVTTTTDTVFACRFTLHLESGVAGEDASAGLTGLDSVSVVAQVTTNGRDWSGASGTTSKGLTSAAFANWTFLTFPNPTSVTGNPTTNRWVGASGVRFILTGNDNGAYNQPKVSAVFTYMKQPTQMGR